MDCQEAEVENGGSAPRMLCLDDYFMVEVDKRVKDPETGKMVTIKTLEYEYEPGIEETYRQSLFKAFKKTVDNGFFSFIIYDSINDKLKHIKDVIEYSKKKDFTIFVTVLTADVATCAARNVHKRSLEEIQQIVDGWEPTPSYHNRLDPRSLLQDAAIPEVEMEDEMGDEGEKEGDKKEEDKDGKGKEDDENGWVVMSKWELDTSGDKLDKLDGLRSTKRKRSPSPQNLEEYLRLDELSEQQQDPGKKRVRWVDIEERKRQTKQREIGFVIGQTERDWRRMTDDSFADKALNKTKYIPSCK